MTECAVDEGRVKDDDFWMGLALEEAAKARRLSPPNPAVGAVIVRDGRVIGRGFTQQTGGPHAEVMALRDAAARGASVEGATIYVTLEPCSHWGRTPPCALAIIEHRIGRVVTSVADPNPQVAGRGLKMIRDAGIEVTEGVRSKEGWLSNRGFLTRMTTGRPWVRMKCAATLDGRTAFPDGRSQWITGPAAREDSQYWRAVSGAVVTGIGTVLADNPKMTVRLPDQVRFPFRVVVDPRLETPVGAEILKGGGTVLVCAQAGEEAEAARRRRRRGAEASRCGASGTRGPRCASRRAWTKAGQRGPSRGGCGAQRELSLRGTCRRDRAVYCSLPFRLGDARCKRSASRGARSGAPLDD